MCKMVTGAVGALAVLLLGCGSESRTERPAQASARWTVEIDRDHGFSVELPSGWTRAYGKLTPQITEPREILAVATLPLAGADPHGVCEPGSRPALAGF